MKKISLLTLMLSLLLGACGTKVSEQGKVVLKIYQTQDVKDLGNLQDYFLLTEEGEEEGLPEELTMLWSEMTHEGGTKNIVILHTKILDETTAIVKFKAEFNDENTEEESLKMKKISDKWKIILD